MNRPVAFLGSVVLVLLLAGCVTTNASRLGTATANRPLVLPQNVALYRTASQVPRRYEEVALLNSTGDALYTDEAKMFESMKKSAGKMGANAVILDALSEPTSGSKVAAAIFGVSAERKGKALAIWIFSDDGTSTSNAQSIQSASPTSVPTSHATGYVGDAESTARQELADHQCSDNFQRVSESNGRSIFEATCKNGKQLLAECWMGACQLLN